MRCECLYFGAGSVELSLQLHPHLTVIGGIGPTERAILVEDMVNALAGPRRGGRAQLVSDNGDPIHSLEQLIRVVPDRNRLAAMIRFGPAAGAHVPARAPQLHHLARIDPAELARAAAAVTATEAKLAELRTAIDTTFAYTESMEQWGEQHEVYEQQRAHADRMRRLGLTGALAFGLLAAAAVVSGHAVAVPLVVMTVALGVASVQKHKRAMAAAEEEQRALRAAGVDTGLGIQLRRVNAMLQGTRHRRDLAQAEAAHEAAVAAWANLAGSVDPARIAQFGDELQLLHTVRAVTQSDATAVGNRLLALLDRIEAARLGGPEGPKLPCILDAALDDLEPQVAFAFLDLLRHRPAVGQVVVLTGCQPIVEWARHQGRAVGLISPRGAMV